MAPWITYRQFTCIAVFSLEMHAHKQDVQTHVHTAFREAEKQPSCGWTLRIGAVCLGCIMPKWQFNTRKQENVFLSRKNCSYLTTFSILFCWPPVCTFPVAKHAKFKEFINTITCQRIHTQIHKGYDYIYVPLNKFLHHSCIFSVIICIFLWVSELSGSFLLPSLVFQATNVS